MRGCNVTRPSRLPRGQYADAWNAVAWRFMQSVTWVDLLYRSRASMSHSQTACGSASCKELSGRSYRAGATA